MSSLASSLFVKPSEAARLLGISSNTVRRMVRDKRLGGRRVLSIHRETYFVSLAAINEFLEEQKTIPKIENKPVGRPRKVKI